MSAVIEVRNLEKVFGSTRALDRLNLEVAQGEVHGFLGPNGSGKSTTIRVLLGILRATGGEATLFGRDPWRDAVDLHRELAYVPGDVTLWPSLSGGETIDLLARMRGGIDESRRAELIDRFDLGSGSLDGTGVSRMCRRGPRPRGHRAAVQPHSLRGGGTV